MSGTLRIEDVTIHRIVEMEMGAVPAVEALPTLTPERLAENRDWLKPTALDANDQLILCFQSFVICTPQQVVLVDPCIGDDKECVEYPIFHRKTDDTWLRGLAAVGLTVDDIDVVLCTHLHVDHIGWNTRLEGGRWRPTFPRARYLLSRTEVEFWLAEHERRPIPAIAESILPVLDAGRCELVTSDHVVNDHVRLLPTPGHTVDHLGVAIGRDGASAVITGDLIHTPLQARYPDLSNRIDHDPAMGNETRRNFLERYCDTDTVVCFTHFPSPSWGHVTRWGQGFRSEPVR